MKAWFPFFVLLATASADVPKQDLLVDPLAPSPEAKPSIFSYGTPKTKRNRKPSPNRSPILAKAEPDTDLESEMHWRTWNYIHNCMAYLTPDCLEIYNATGMVGMVMEHKLKEFRADERKRVVPEQQAQPFVVRGTKKS